MKRVFIILVFFIFIPSLLLSQTGKIAGRITSKATDKPLEGVAVFLEDSKIGTYSQKSGTYILRNVPVGELTLYARYMGYATQSKEIIVEKDITTQVNFEMVIEAVKVEGITISANRAVKRETPIAFTNINEEIISEKYTTEDIPLLLDGVPGLFSCSSGLGESGIFIRGFDAEKIQILINGIPVNDPESQVVYWSNWTGLSSNIKSVQVQRGAGSSLYGSGALGGSVNIETIGSAENRNFTLRTSVGYYTTDGKVADGKGGMQDYEPVNLNVLLRYESGDLFNDKFNFSATAERKYGDSYVVGTVYDGYSFGFETENKFGAHTLNTSFIIAPQEHLQARSNSDIELAKFLGREFNPTKHPWQENHYVKPQFSIRDKWLLSDHQSLVTNVFVTRGNGGGGYLNNGLFDIETGEIYFKDILDAYSEGKRFGKHARFVYDLTGEILEGYNPDTKYFTYAPGDSVRIPTGMNMVTGDGAHSWKNISNNDHKQFGLNTYYQHELSKMLNIIIGGEIRSWNADHYAESNKFRYFNPNEPDSLGIYSETQRRYDYSSTVTNLSVFLRTQIKPIKNLNIMLDGQFASYNSKVEENPIYVFDFLKGELTDISFYQTKDMTEIVFNPEDSTWIEVKKFAEDDYKRTFEFFSPKCGLNYNLTDKINLIANYSIAYKEPRVLNWYDRTDGPGVNQILDDGEEIKLVPEQTETKEFGIGFESSNLNANANYYFTDYTDKIESIQDAHGESKTINAGIAKHQGLELSFKAKYFNFDFSGSVTSSKNRWQKMNLQKIFYEDAEYVIGKVVPYSPEKMANGNLGYTFYGLPLDGNLRIGLSVKWWDEYYGTYTNEYIKEIYFYDADGNFHSDGEHEFVSNPDGTGNYNLDEFGNYVYVSSGGDYDKEYIVSSSKLPYFLEFNGSLSYKFYIGKKEALIRINLNNIFNRKDNYTRAYISELYGRSLNGTETDPHYDAYYPYVSPSPLFNMFLTVEVKF
ncbi:MAG: TonB-dependent receptor [Candidatus Cloacimonetes bacterium]|nr:TonB-dependent receptor [Candidatus Cloacimonadota bacterium]